MISKSTYHGILIAVICLFIVILNADAADIQQTVKDTGAIAQIIESIANTFTNYGWRISAVILAPLIVFNIGQWWKLINKKLFGRKPHWLLMDILSWLGVFVLSGWFLLQRYPENLHNVTVAAFIIACFHTTIIKMIFKFAPKPVADVLQHGVYVNGDKTQLFAATLLGYGGVEKRKNKREVDFDVTGKNSK